MSSIHRQDTLHLHEIEILLIDDGSTDDTVRIAKNYADRLPLQILGLPRSGNWTQSVNIGLQKSRGDYSCILHQDDVWYSGRLNAVRAMLNQFPEANLLLHPSRFIDVAGRSVSLWRCPLPRQRGCLEPNVVWQKLIVQNFVACCAPVFRTETARNVGMLDEDLFYTADWDFWLKLTATGHTLFCPEFLLSVRIHPDSQTMQYAAGNAALWAQYTKVLDRHLRPWEDGRPSRIRVSQLARYSAKVNLALATWAGGGPVPSQVLLWDFLRLGPVNGFLFLHQSGIIARTMSRLFARRLTGWMRNSESPACS